MRYRILPVLLFLVLQPNGGLGDFPCACNYHTSHSVYESPSAQTIPAGYLYKAECKPLVERDDLDKDWVAIAMFHKVAYMKLDFKVHIETCPGEQNPSDKLTTTSIQLPPSSSTELWSTQRPSIVPSSTYSSQGTKVPEITKTSVKHTDVVMTSQPSTDTHVTTSTTATIVSGDTGLCPDAIQQLAETGNGVLTQYGSHCLQLDLSKVIWQEAEWRCRSQGGHLVEIHDQAENDFVKRFVSMHTFFPVWIGLHDTVTEEIFRWTSDPNKPVTYVNWSSNHHTDQHGEEDCAVFGPDGQWDDRRCGHYATVDNLALQYGYVCQYDIISPNLIPIG